MADRNLGQSSSRSGMTFDAAESFHKRYLNPDDDRGRTSGSLGDALSQAIKFEEIKVRLKQLVDSGKPDKVIASELKLNLFDIPKFKEKLGKVKLQEFEEPEPVQNTIIEKVRNREVDLEEFLADPRGNIDIISWQSYYSILKFAAKELANVRHAKDHSLGILLNPNDLYPLIRKAFGRMYPVDVVKKVKARKLNPIFIRTDKESVKIESNTGSRIRMRHIIIREEVFEELLREHREKISKLEKRERRSHE
jgi:hypothetical protein